MRCGHPAATATATKPARALESVEDQQDADADGICDDVDDCVARLTLVASATAQRDLRTVVRTSQKVTATATETSSTPESVGDVLEDADADGIRDDVHCVGAPTLVAPATDQEIYECGCADIPEGDCDCNGNQADALGECGGDCAGRR